MEMDPYKTIYVLKVNGKEVGRVPAMRKNAKSYIEEISSFHLRRGKSVDIEYHPDPTGGLLYLIGK